MKRNLVAGAACALALALSGCSTTSGSSISDAIKEIASDPRCGHIDRIQGNLGGLSANNLSLFLERTCPPAPAVAIGVPATTVPAPSIPVAP